GRRGAGSPRSANTSCCQLLTVTRGTGRSRTSSVRTPAALWRSIGSNPEHRPLAGLDVRVPSLLHPPRIGRRDQVAREKSRILEKCVIWNDSEEAGLGSPGQEG